MTGNGVVTQLLRLIEERGAATIGISGAPGSGKSTVARAVASSHAGDVLVLSLDDFYLPRQERLRRQIPWRGPPGSHDLDALLAVLEDLRAKRLPVQVPRFAADIDDRGTPETVASPPDLVILEGFYLGYAEDGYEQILPYLDLLVFLDVDAETARRRRFAREAELRATGGGFSEDEMQRFWDEVLDPGIPLWTRPARASADLVLSNEDDR